MRTFLSCVSTRTAALLLLLCIAGPARADLFDEHTDRGIALYQAQRYEDAIAEFKAAYALRQWPRLLLNIGQAQLKLGHAREALDHYQAYLRVRPTPEPEIRAELERAMGEARALLRAQEEPAPPLLTPPPEPRPQLVAPTPPWRRWWFWTSLGLAAGAVAATTAVLVTRPWLSPAWTAVPEDNRREVGF